MRATKTLAAGVTVAVAIAAAMVVHQQPAAPHSVAQHSMMNHGQPPSAIEAAAMERLQAAPVPGSEFRAECLSSHRAGDDPIVFPGQSGASHIHEFYGNTTTNASSTLQSLRLGGTNCDPVADKSAYWTPTLYQNGVPVAPERVTIYLDFPTCWDGVRLDSPNHKDHMAFPAGATCPATHPVVVPRLEFLITYPVNGGGLTLAGTRNGTLVTTAPGYTFHGDFLNAGSWRYCVERVPSEGVRAVSAVTSLGVGRRCRCRSRRRSP